MDILPVDRFEILKKMVGANIKKIRLIRSIEVKKLCLDLNISPAAYSNIERGITDVTVSKLVLLADYFRIPYEQILAFNPVTFDQVAEELVAPEKEVYPAGQSLEGFLIALEQAREENKFLKEQNNKLLNMLALQRGNEKNK